MNEWMDGYMDGWMDEFWVGTGFLQVTLFVRTPVIIMISWVVCV
jgi:hypothetical protein